MPEHPKLDPHRTTTPSRCRVHPDLRELAYCYGVRAGGLPEWEFAFSRYKAETIASEKVKLLHGLACTKEPWILNM